MLKVYGESEGKELYYEISSPSETFTFDKSALGNFVTAITLQNFKEGKNEARLFNVYLIRKDGTEERIDDPKQYGVYHDCSYELIMPRKQFVHTVSFDGLWSELNIFNDDVPLKLKNYKGIRLELAEMPKYDTCHLKVYGDGEKNTDDIGLTGTSTTITFNPDIFSSEINRVTLISDVEDLFSVKVIGAWLIRQDGTEEYSDLSTYHNCMIVDVSEYGNNKSICVKITTAKQVPYCSEYNLDFTDKPELKAYVATGYDKATGTIWLTRVKQVPAETGFLLMGDAGDYDIPVAESAAECYYKDMFKGTISGETIYTTDGDYTNYYLSNGEYGVGFYKVGSSVDLKANRAYLSIPTNIPAAGSEDDTEVIKVGAALQVPYYTSKNLDFSTMDVQGVKAYTATGYNYGTGTIWLTRVKKVPAKTGVLVMADAAGEYSIPTASVSSYYANMFVGSETAQTIYMNETIDGVNYVNYYLSNGASGLGFYKVTKENGVKMGANRCYLPIPKRDTASGARGKNGESAFCQMILSDESNDDVIAIPLFADDATGINVQSSMFNLQSNEVYYNLQGQRVDNPGKGLYIKNGKKVILR